MGKAPIGSCVLMVGPQLVDLFRKDRTMSLRDEVMLLEVCYGFGVPKDPCHS